MANLRAHYFQHVPFEGLGSIENWLTGNGYSISSTEFFDPGHRLPETGEVDLLIAMGGPMSVNDEGKHPWLVEEKRFIADSIAAGKPVLGICLGAQLIASAMGAKVYPNREQEIGWFDVSGEPGGDPDRFHFPDDFMAFHWHGETFDLPPGAHLLAGNHVCRNQGFQLGSNVIGLQFHLETTEASVQALVKHCGDELTGSDFVQTPGQILFAPGHYYESIHQIMEDVLAFITRRN